MSKYDLTNYYAKQKFWKFLGAEVRIYDETKTNLLFFVKQKAFKLKEDITIFSDESQTKELLKIQAKKVIDFSAAYNVTNTETGEKLGALRRKGFKSMLRDSWEVLDKDDNVIGKIDEDSMGMALLRRFLSNLIPQKFQIKIGETTVGNLKQAFNPFVTQFNVDFSMDAGGLLDRKMGIASVVLLQLIEGRQQ